MKFLLIKSSPVAAVLSIAFVLMSGSVGKTENNQKVSALTSEVVDTVQFHLQDFAVPTEARAALSRESAVSVAASLVKADTEVKGKPFFSIQQLTCQANTRISCKDIEKRLRNAGALSLWSLNKQRIGDFSFSKFSSPSSFSVNQIGGSSLIKDVLTENPWIEDASIEFSTFNRSAQVTIREAVPWFVTELRKSNWVVSRRGALLQEVNSIVDPTVSYEVAQLPRVRGIERQRGALVTREAEAIRIMTQFLSVVNSISGLPYEVESYELLEDDSVAISPLSSTIPTVFIRGDTAEDSRAKLELLKKVLLDSKARGESLQRVDLRFKGRAVVVKQPETSPLSKPAKLS
jgi:hypothetical protein